MKVTCPGPHVKRGGTKKRLAVERFDSEPVAETEIFPLLPRHTQALIASGWKRTRPTPS